MKNVPISDIKILPNRQRKELKDIDVLANSLQQFGQIQPIVLSNSTLVAGERRLTAAKSLGWDSILAIDMGELSPTEKQAIELEENIKRRQLDWQDEIAAIYNYHQLRLAANPSQTIGQTGVELGMSMSPVYKAIMVYEEILAGNTMVAQTDKFITAFNMVERKRDRSRQAELDSISAVFEEPDAPSTPTVPFTPAAPAAADDAPYLQQDFLTYTTHQKFNFIHCDFPYGISHHEANRQDARPQTTYEDSPETYFTLLSHLLSAPYISQSAHLMFWFAMDYYTETTQRLANAGWAVNPYPLLWHKSDNKGLLPDPQRGPRRIYETALLAYRGDRKIVRAVSNVFSHPVLADAHMSEKPQPMLEHFFRMFIDDSTNMLDPTCGAGSSVRAAAALSANSYLGIEKEEEFYNSCLTQWRLRDA